jgi:hypothetical protein
MEVFVPERSHAVVLSFLFLGFLLGVCGLVFLHASLTERRERARRVLLAAIALGIVYGAVLLVASLVSKERVLAARQQKYFCEVDCHVANSVESVVAAKTLGSGSGQATAQGTFYVVTIKTWFDADTISSRRAKDMPLWPNPRSVGVVDAQGRRFLPSLEGQKALETAGNVPLTQPLRPGESYTTTFVFDLPADAAQPRLLLTAADPVTIFLIGHENSLLHKKVYFDLEPATVKENRQSQAPTHRAKIG